MPRSCDQRRHVPSQPRHHPVHQRIADHGGCPLYLCGAQWHYLCLYVNCLHGSQRPRPVGLVHLYVSLHGWKHVQGKRRIKKSRAGIKRLFLNAPFTFYQDYGYNMSPFRTREHYIHMAEKWGYSGNYFSVPAIAKVLAFYHAVCCSNGQP